MYHKVIIATFVFSSFLFSQVDNNFKNENRRDIKSHLLPHERFLQRIKEREKVKSFLHSEEDKTSQINHIKNHPKDKIDKILFGENKIYGNKKPNNITEALLNNGVNSNAASSITEEWVRHYASGLLPSQDFAHAITVDIEGNVYVTGYSEASLSEVDYLTIKYSSSGIEQWASRYNGPGNSFDEANAIAVDAAGNVYVTGSSTGTGTGDPTDYATIKYNSTGAELWVSRYNGPGNSGDFAASIAIDESGNVYVTGISSGSGTSLDYATIKYNTAGVEQWTARYNGAGNASDEAYVIAVDALGNVYVTGGSEGSGTSTDYATIKYNSAGIEQWTARYNGPGNSSDYASSITIDESGNVYVTGASEGSSTSTDYATVKYNSTGVEQWTARYNGPGNSYDGASSIALGASGNVYITGSSYGTETSRDYATIQYNSVGVEQWVTRYNGPGNNDDAAASIVLDESGNVYVTGFSASTGYHMDYATIKYNSAGIEQWTARYNGPGDSEDEAYDMAVDASGNVYVTGQIEGSGTSWDYATIKYNSAGVEQWNARYNGPGNSYEYAASLAVDASGNVYVTGMSEGSGTSGDYATIKYNSAGVEQWTARYNGPANGDDMAWSIAVDASGNVYVTGQSDGLGSLDYATIKYNSAGIEQWAARYNGPGNSYEYAASLAVDASGNVYVTGRSYGLGSLDYATIKYNSAGVEQWTARYNGPGNGDDMANSIAVDASGNVYVTGGSSGSGTSLDYATIKYNSTGVEQWVSRYNGPGNGDDMANSIAVDVSGNVYVTGGSSGSGTSLDYATIKYNSAGVEQWTARYNGPGNYYDEAYDMAVDASGNVYVTGESEGSGTGWDYATIKYNSAGIEQWTARYTGPGSSEDYATSIAVDASGNVYITGFSTISGDSRGYATIKYNLAGVEQWTAIYDSPGEISEGIYIAIDVSGNVYVTSTTYFLNSDVYTTIKYNQKIECPLWTKHYNNSGVNKVEGMGFNIPTDIKTMTRNLAVDISGNMYVAGFSDGGTTSLDYVTIKYDYSGLQNWATRYNNPSVNKIDKAYALTLDNIGNVYITGESNGGATKMDIVTIKYNASGEQEWIASYNNEHVNKDDAGYAITTNLSGTTVFVTGKSDGGFGHKYDYITLAYDAATGSELWQARYSMPGNDIAYAITCDLSGNVIVTGESNGGPLRSDYATLKYTSSGIELWVERYNAIGKKDYAFAVKTDISNNIYITGTSESTTKFDYATIKYSPSGGAPLWVARYNCAPVNKNDIACDVVLDDSGNVYVTGTSEGSGTKYDYTTIKYNSSGTQKWINRYDGGIRKKDIARSIAVCDGSGKIFITGNSDQGTGRKNDYVTLKIDAVTGITEWVGRYNGPGYKNDIAYNVAVRPGVECCIALTGNSDGGWLTKQNIATIQGPSDSPVPAAITSPLIDDGEYESEEIPSSFTLFQNYPNPFNPFTTLKFALPQPAVVTMSIYNVLGQEVVNLIDNELYDEGEFEVEFDAQGISSGVYFYRIHANELSGDNGSINKTNIIIKKMLHLK